MHHPKGGVGTLSKHFCSSTTSFRALFLLFLLLSGTFFSCTTLPKDWNHPGSHEPTSHEIESVRFFSQEAFQCGPASLAMVLTWSGIAADPTSVTSAVFTPSKKGSLQSSMISATRRYGRIAYPISGVKALLKEIAVGHPVIVLQNLGLSWFPKWHYAVVIGYDLNAGFVMLHSGDMPRKHLALRVFDNTWARSDRWGLVVVPPNILPATAVEEKFVSAVIGLEKSGQWKAAIEGYTAALNRWPDSLGALMGLGNSHYALGNINAAENAFRLATHRFPTEGSAFNNLAQVLWEQGKHSEALDSVKRAISVGGPLIHIYRETLRQIQSEFPPEY
jgi:hypothetical protein